MGNLNFNATQIEPQKALEPLPTDWYNIIITESEMKPTSTQDGHRLACIAKSY